MNKWIIKYKNGKEKNFVDRDSVDNFRINRGINFIVGKNNTGKTLMLNSLARKDFEIYNGESQLNPIIVNFKFDSIFIESENKATTKISKEDPISNLINNKQDEIIEYDDLFDSLENYENSSLEEFLKDKKIQVKRSTKDVITASISNLPTANSGTGENRILYLLYSMSTLCMSIDRKIREIREDNVFMLEFIENISNEFSEANIQLMKELLNNRNNILMFDSIESFDSFIAAISKLMTLSGINLGSETPLLIYSKLWFDWNLHNRIIIRDGKDGRLDYRDMESLKNFKLKWKNELGVENDYLRLSNSDYIEIYRRVNKKLGIDISTDILFLIDEPDAYINSSMYKLLADSFKYIITKYEEFEFDIRILISTHEERILKDLNDYIFNTTVFYKHENRICFKNIFKNDPDLFISSIKDDFENYFNSRYGNKEKKKEEILKDMSYLDIDYLKWFITLKDNLRILMSDKILIVEGYFDKIVVNEFKSRLNINEIIEADGTYLGMFIWLKIIEYSKGNFSDVSLLIDLDYEYKHKRVKEHTQLMREYIYDKFSGLITMYSSLFNDITEWAHYINESILFNKKAKEALLELEKTREDIDWRDRERIEGYRRDHNHIVSPLIEELYGKLNIDKQKIKNKYSLFSLNQITKNFLEEEKNNQLLNKNYYFSYLFNEKKIFRTIDDYFKSNNHEVKNNENWIKIEDGNILADEYIGYEYKDLTNEVGDTQWVKLSLDSEMQIGKGSKIINKFDGEDGFQDDDFIFGVLDIENKKVYEISKKDGDDRFYKDQSNRLKVKAKLVNTIEISKIESNTKFNNLYRVYSKEGCKVITGIEIYNYRNRDVINDNTKHIKISMIDPKTKINYIHNFNYENYIDKFNIEKRMFEIDFYGSRNDLSAIIGPIDMSIEEFEEEFDFEKSWKEI